MLNDHSLLKLANPELASKIKNDLDYAEIRGETAEKINKWFEKALITEGILFLVRNNLATIEGLLQKNMLFGNFDDNSDKFLD